MMPFKAMLLLLSTFLVVTTRVSSNYVEPAPQGHYGKVPVPAEAPASVPAKAPAYAPPPKVTIYAPPPKATAPVPPVKEPAPAPMSPVTSVKEYCVPRCEERCKLNRRKRSCVRACMTCCDRCKCVPPGTFGNKEKCGKCYTEMTTRGQKYKCP